MNLFFLISLLSTGSFQYVQAGRTPNFLQVYYRHDIVLGEQASLTITPPPNVFWDMLPKMYAPNGTSQTIDVIGNVPFIINGGNLPSDLNQTCVGRYNVPGPIRNVPRVPDVAGVWQYSIIMNLYYPSPDGVYQYSANGTAVCLTEQSYKTEQVSTERHNITVLPSSNGATTLSISSGSTTTQLPIAPSAGVENGLFFTEQWAFTESPVGNSFDGVPVSASERKTSLSVCRTLAFPILFLLFASWV